MITRSSRRLWRTLRSSPECSLRERRRDLLRRADCRFHTARAGCPARETSGRCHDTGSPAGALFPTAHAFAGDSVTGYRGLLGDLETRLRPFFEGPARDFAAIAIAHGRRD